MAVPEAGADARLGRWRTVSRVCTALACGVVGLVSLQLLLSPGAVIASHGLLDQDSATLRMALGGWGWGHLLVAGVVGACTWWPERQQALYGWLLLMVLNGGGLANTLLRGEQLSAEAHASNLVMDGVLFSLAVVGLLAHARLERS